MHNPQEIAVRVIGKAYSRGVISHDTLIKAIFHNTCEMQQSVGDLTGYSLGAIKVSTVLDVIPAKEEVYNG